MSVLPQCCITMIDAKKDIFAQYRTVHYKAEQNGSKVNREMNVLLVLTCGECEDSVTCFGKCIYLYKEMTTKQLKKKKTGFTSDDRIAQSL